MSGDWFSGLTDDGRPIVIDGHQVKTASVTRQADGMLSVEFGDSGSVIMASPELVQEWADNVNTLTAQRDAARDIAARLEGELARVRSVVLGLDHYRECPGAYGAYNACDCGHSDLMEATGGEVLTGSALRTPWPHPDAVIAEGES